jgi:hypothetical protein
VTGCDIFSRSFMGEFAPHVAQGKWLGPRDFQIGKSIIQHFDSLRMLIGTLWLFGNFKILEIFPVPVCIMIVICRTPKASLSSLTLRTHKSLFWVDLLPRKNAALLFLCFCFKCPMHLRRLAGPSLFNCFVQNQPMQS